MQYYIIDNNGWVLFNYPTGIEATLAYVSYKEIWEEMHESEPIDCQMHFTKDSPVKASNGSLYFPQFR